MLHNFFYQIYILKNSKTMWIVRESEDYKELKSNINGFISKDERYMIVRVKYTEDEINSILNSKFKRFQKFIFDRSDKIVFDTSK